jgi:hypothetical protein
MEQKNRSETFNSQTTTPGKQPENPTQKCYFFNWESIHDMSVGLLVV